MEARSRELEDRLLERLAEEGYQTPSLEHWLPGSPDRYAGAEPLLLEALEETSSSQLILVLAQLLRKSVHRPAVPVLLGKIGDLNGRTHQYRLAREVFKLGVEGYVEVAGRALETTRALAAQKTLAKAIRRTGNRPPQTDVLAREERRTTFLLAMSLLLVGGITVGLVPPVTHRAGLLVGTLQTIAGVLTLGLAWQIGRRRYPPSRRIFPYWCAFTVTFHFAYQFAVTLFPWTTFALIECAIFAILYLVWREFLQDR